MKAPRQRAIRDLLQRTEVHSQDELVELLEEQGFEVTQSSVCRDLRELEVAKVAGVYRLPPPEAEDATEFLAAALHGVLRSITPAGANLLVVQTAVGAATRVGLAIDRARWPEVVGTVAGDDTLFLATVSSAHQKRVARRLRAYVREAKGRVA